MLSKRYESTEVDRRTWLHVLSGTHWSTSSDTHQVVEIQIETSTKMYVPFLKCNSGRKDQLLADDAPVIQELQWFKIRFNNHFWPIPNN